ncbi:exopolysaccharide biosynthesis polyprenyl glycosylphosphotransferase [Bilifractor sp. HCP3S3_D3]|uniref:exopolysaccharide biosynthesis polyprenyl glycosylphosphotransferase n=1 Tax=Bilifractor sp. HCP3S3_D3 TaxID=3438907 RepID=UPI003F8CC75D
MKDKKVFNQLPVRKKNYEDKNAKSKLGTGIRNGKVENENRVLVRFVKLLDVLVIVIVYGIIWMHCYSSLVYMQPFYRVGNIVMIFLYALFFYYLAHIYQGFYLHISRISEIIYSQTLAAVISNFLIYFISVLLIRRLPNLLPMLLCLALDIVIIAIWSTVAHKWFFRHYARKKTIVIYDELDGVDELIKENGLDSRYKVINVVPIDKVDDRYMNNKLKEAQLVFLCSIHSHERNQIVKFCVANNIRAFVIPRIGDVIISGAEQLHLMHLPMLLVGRYDPKPEYLAIKRFCDIVLSGMALVILSPLMIILSIIIRSDGGTAFYKQVRLTKDGREFNVLKFRSMRMDAEKDGVARLSTGENDPRITKVGRFIRACRMDELPQLINILKGDMSIVGPRPERPEIAKEYEKKLPEFKLRLQCKCGLTGYAQVYGKYNSTPYDKLLMDLMYISKPSLAEDLKIIFATVKILFMKESTEGVAEGQTTASAESLGNTEVPKQQDAEKR